MATSPSPAQGDKRFTREERSWILYDCANSAYVTIVCATLLPIFFNSIATANGLTDAQVTSNWGYATSLGMLICAILAPILGAFGDIDGYKKKLFTASVILGVVFTVMLATTSNWLALLAFYVLSNIGLHVSCLMYDSFLPDVTDNQRIDRVSAYGYAVGYITGSTIPLVVAVLLYQFGEKIGVSQDAAMRISFVMTAVWWAVFTVPMLRDVKQKHGLPRERGLLRQSLGNMVRTFHKIRQDKGLLWYILAYFFYIDGVGTIIHMAVRFGESKGLPSVALLLILMAVQLVAFPCAILYSKLAKRYGARTMIFVGIITYLVVCVVAGFLSTLVHFVLLGILVGTAQGGIQALSRSYFGKLVPKENASEYFGFFEVLGKFSAVMGPALFGLFADWTGVTQLGILPIAALFLIGGGLFYFKVPKGQEESPLQHTTH